MFGPYQFGEPYFAKAINLNGTVVKRVTTQVVYPCRKRECATTPDIEIYSLQDALKFNADALSVIVNCPPGFICPDGLFPLVVTYPPGTFYLPDPQTPGFPILMTMQGCKSVVTITLPATATQAEIDAAAQQLILQIAAQQAECDAEEQYGPFTPQPPAGAVQFGQLSDNIICLGVGTFVAIPMTSTYTPVTTAITGSIPTGMTGSQTADSLTNLISGTPTVAGDYSFSIKASPPFTNPVIQNFVLTVFGITNAASLTAYTVGSAYSETLVTGGTVIGPVTFEVTDGSLPAGLSLDENTGEISGTPTAEGTSAFTVTVTDLGSTVACSKAFTLQNASAFCDIYAAFLWTFINSFGSAVTTIDVNVPYFKVEATGDPGGGFSSGLELQGSFFYVGNEITCSVAVKASGDGEWGITIWQDSTLILDVDSADEGYGNFVFPFTIAATAGSVIIVNNDNISTAQSIVALGAAASFIPPDPEKTINLEVSFLGPIP